MLPNLLNPRVQAAIVFVLLAMFGGAMFVPVFVKDFKIDADMKQTLFQLATLAVVFYFGKNSDTARKDEQAAAITAQVLGAPPALLPPVVDPIKGPSS